MDTTSTEKDRPGVSHSDWYDADNDFAAHDENYNTHDSNPDGSHDIHHESRSTDEAGNWTGSDTVDTPVFTNGPSMYTTTSIVVDRDEDGKVTGTTKEISTSTGRSHHRRADPATAGADQPRLIRRRPGSRHRAPWARAARIALIATVKTSARP